MTDTTESIPAPGTAAAAGPAPTRPHAALDDMDLVRLTLDGETEAFSELARRHETIVYNVAYRFMRDGAAAEDMAQEAFIKAFRLLKSFRGDSKFSTWLYRVTCTVCLTELNRRKRRREVHLVEGSPDLPTVPPAGADDMPEIVRRCVESLPGRYANIITQYYLKERSYREIANDLGVPAGTLKTWMFRARKQLRKRMEKELCTDG